MKKVLVRRHHLPIVDRTACPRRTRHTIPSPARSSLFREPGSTPVSGMNLPLGGGYFRLLPTVGLVEGCAASNQLERHPVCAKATRELDPDNRGCRLKKLTPACAIRQLQLKNGA